MLRQLSVENIAIIDQAEITFGPGFTAMTGETGAGKSLLIDAIGLALGERADSDLVRSGSSKGSVTLLADLSDSPSARKVCTDLGIALDASDEVLISREVTANGRSSVRINGQPSSVGILKQVGDALVDLHGQHDHQSLLQPDRQIDFLDEWIGHECVSRREKVAVQFAKLQASRRKLSSMQTSQKEREQRIDMLKFQISEIHEVNPGPGELEEQEHRLRRLQNAERLAQASLTALEVLQDQEGSSIDSMQSALGSLESILAYDDDVGAVIEPLRNASFHLEEGVRGLRQYAQSLDLDPAALEQTAERVEAIRALRRKYGPSEEELFEHLAAAGRELEDLQQSELSETELAEQVAHEEEVLMDIAGKLSALRRRRAVEFQAIVQGHVQDLAMEKALFEVKFTEKFVEGNGIDVVELLFCANPGEPLLPLVKTASGGELSRVMLAIKAAGAGLAGVPSMIFDEVDSGLGGRAAAVMASKLQELAGHCQVLVITHLPQIAGKANEQWQIEKSDEMGRSVTRLTQLKGDERIAEIARMLAGEEVGDSAIANAKELLG